VKLVSLNFHQTFIHPMFQRTLPTNFDYYALFKYILQPLKDVDIEEKVRKENNGSPKQHGNHH
jgi:hypothetical protein